MNQNHLPELLKGLFAVSVNALAVITSSMEHLEFGLRITSLVIGILVGILTAISIVKNIFK